MANRLQLRRGTSAPGGIFYEGEPVYDKTNKVLYVGDSGASGSGNGSAVASASAYGAVAEILNQASSTAPGSIKLYEDTDNGTNYVAVAASTLIGQNYTLTLPNGTGTDGQVLKTDGSGNLDWVNQTSGFSGFSITDGSNTETIATNHDVLPGITWLCRRLCTIVFMTSPLLVACTRKHHQRKRYLFLFRSSQTCSFFVVFIPCFGQRSVIKNFIFLR